MSEGHLFGPKGLALATGGAGLAWTSREEEPVLLDEAVIAGGASVCVALADSSEADFVPSVAVADGSSAGDASITGESSTGGDACTEGKESLAGNPRASRALHPASRPGR